MKNSTTSEGIVQIKVGGNIVMERIWSREAAMKYPKQWIVLVNIEDEKETNKVIGDVYLVTSDEDEAHRLNRELDGVMGETMVVTGYDDTPQIGGLWSL